MKTGIRVCVDRGGTFTDCIAFVPNHIHPVEDEKPDLPFRTIVVKLLSVDPNNYADAPTEGIRRILEIATGTAHPRHMLIDSSNIELIRMGTTVGTNALLERKGERVALLITEGFKDLLQIGNQSRPNLFDLSITVPDVLYEYAIEVDERVYPVKFPPVSTGSTSCQKSEDEKYVQGITGEWLHILKKPEIARRNGIDSVAICLMHSYTFQEHEQILEKLCYELGFKNVTLSSKITPMIKIVPRGVSTTADSYLTPVIKNYLQSFFAGFDQGLLGFFNSREKVRVEFMQSDGGLVDADKFNGFKAILSGPAGGVVGFANTSWESGGQAVIGFDMGGTSTDVSRFGGRYEHVFESTTAGITIQAPQLDINTEGGGSRLFFRNGMFVVGPESASADPGPTCYRKNGPLTITDANLILGRLDSDYFPKIFGEKEREGLDLKAAKVEFDKLAIQVNSFLTLHNLPHMTSDEIAQGFIRVANESMCRPIRALTQGKGFNASDHILACFGGAGGQHAFAIARSLGISTILIHKFASILSAYGQALADIVEEKQEPSSCNLNNLSLPGLRGRLEGLADAGKSSLLRQGFPESHIRIEMYLNLRYHGTDTSIMTLKPELLNDWGFENAFQANYKNEFGFNLPDRHIVVDDIRIRATGRSIATGKDTKGTSVSQELRSIVPQRTNTCEKKSLVYWETCGRIMTPIFLRQALKIGDEVIGPALIMDDTSTIAVEPGCRALLTSEHIVGFVENGVTNIGTSLQCDPVLLSVFGHRFMSIAEQMGYTLQKTSISTNIKERLDFSCALFGPDGGLVANAPHIPVHLGSMQEAVRWQINYLGKEIQEGDVLVTNHPMAGGSHLPDITVITPVFEKGVIVFFVASRGHHADIGGKRAGSMPPDSKELHEEGASFKSFLLVRDGIFNEVGITKILLVDPAQFTGCSGTRSIKDNVSDLKAQIAANCRGIALIKSLIDEFGLSIVHSYMNHIQENAQHAVIDLLKKTYLKLGPIINAEEQMDDGSKIVLKVTINGESGTAEFDFEGTGVQVYGNTNAPPSVTYSAIIYCLRCLIDIDMPLNQGALKPISIKIPNGCMLNPDKDAAVVGGNVLTSQRLCDVIFKAFQACAASQGCCNNLTFGKDDADDLEAFGYYETIAGGAGAGPTWNGKSGIHTHMTNTRITDPEILERRYPVILRSFGIRSNSGGRGLHDGGNGVVREFLETVQLSILSERRVFQPYGLEGGEGGAVGVNTLFRRDGRIINFGGKNSTVVGMGDRIRVETPGGGGWGKNDGLRKDSQYSVRPQPKKFGGSLQKHQDSQNST